MRALVQTVLALLALVAARPAGAQGVPSPPAAPLPADTLGTPPGTPQAGRDTSVVTPPAEAFEPLGVPLAPAAEGGLERPVTYTARDSVRIVLGPRRAGTPEGAPPGPDAPDDRVMLYGEAEARYDEATLAAGVIEFRFRIEELRAEAGLAEGGTPRFAQGQEAFSGQTLVYNLRSGRGRIVEARTQIQDGFLLGGVIRQQSARVVFAQDAAYTTCDLDEPHYHVVAGRIKVVDGKHVYTGPVQLRLLGLPTPLWLPFGFFPATEGRRSGPLAVGYGQSRDFGLYLRDVGWYWAASDFFDVLGKAQLGTTGSFQAEGVVQYARRYAYAGRVSASYGRLRSGERLDPDFRLAIPAALGWGHNQTFAAGQRLTASVDLRSNAQRFVTQDVLSQVQQSTSSSVSFSQAWPRVGRSVGLSLRGSQQLQTGAADFTLPDVTLNQQRRFPFRPAGSRGGRWFEQVSLAYTGTFRNAYRFTPVAGLDSTVSFLDGLLRPSAFRAATGQDSRFDYSARHAVPLSASYTLPRFRLSLTPSLNYDEIWSGRRTERAFNPETGQAVTTPVEAFTAVRLVRASVGGSSEFFGTFPVRVGVVDGLRHIVRPSVSANFAPDYARAPFRYVREVQTNAAGRTERFAIAPGVPLAPTAALGFGVENAFVARTVRTDTTGQERRQTVQLFSLGLNGGYNFADDVRPIQDLSAAFNSQIGRYRVNANASYSAYALDSLGAFTSTPYLTATGRPLRLNGLSLSAGTQFASRERSGPQDLRPVRGPALPGTPGVGYDPAFPDYRAPALGFVDYVAPWSLGLDFTAGYTPAFGASPARWNAVATVTQFNWRFTPNWAVSGSTGFDLVQMEPTLTRLALRRDLHCWEMQLDVTPFGQFQQVGFSLYVKSGYLTDLLRLDLPRADFRSAFQGVTRL